MKVYLDGHPIDLKDCHIIGRGGEADIFKLGAIQAVKIFKTANHPDLALAPSHERRIANLKLQEHQDKLPALIKLAPQLSPKVVIPQKLLTNKQGQIIGYIMPLITPAEILFRFGQPSFRKANSSNNGVVEIFRDLRSLVEQIHRAKVVIGDFNDLNVLISNDGVFMIDSDSFQFGKFLCHMFTYRFVDPTHCQFDKNNLILTLPHNTSSDWYAFAVMLFNSLLLVDPYSGVYVPDNPSNKLTQEQRLLQRVTVFNDKVKYPKKAIHFSVLPDELLSFFVDTLQQDKRDPFPIKLLANLRWTTCQQCHREHARSTCPNCFKIDPELIRSTTIVRGQVIATQIFQTEGTILHACCQYNQLRWLYYERGGLYRENKQEILKGNLANKMRFRISGANTLIGRDNQLAILGPSGSTQLLVDDYDSLPMFNTTSQTYYWLHAGQLQYQTKLGPEFIGDVLGNRTVFWLGEHFGFGFYLAGQMTIYFTFTAGQRGMNDQLKLPPFNGQLLDAYCTFSDQYCYFFTSVQERGQIVNRCFKLDSSGTILASAQAIAGDGSWLGVIRGKTAIGNLLFAATDSGISRIESAGNHLVSTKEFPDAEPFVDNNSKLFASREGIFVVNDRNITLLKIA